jgi:AraC-like DNA-binding protein
MLRTGMPDGTVLSTIDLFVRGGVCLLLLLVTALLLRDYSRAVSARLGALFAVGTAAFAVCSSSSLHTAVGTFAVVVLAIATGNNLVFWLFVQALFDDGFRPRWWHVGIWAVLVSLGLIASFGPATWPAVAPSSRGVLTCVALGFAALAVWRTLASWRDDVVETRRHLRAFIVGASSCYILLTALADLLGAREVRPATTSIIEACGLAAIAGAVAWSLLRVSGDGLFVAPAAATEISPPAASRSLPPDPGLVAALEHIMAVERAYRREGLTIGRLAELLGSREYALRQLINQGLGFRNFNSFLNKYRIADATAALADPGQSGVPITTIALDAGFSSLGPFNRAFKAGTGMTPSEYRRAAASTSDAALADSGIGQPPLDGERSPARRAVARSS